MSIRSRIVRWPGWVGWLAAIAVLGAGASVGVGDEADGRAVVTGTVVDEAGKPVAGVQVSAEVWEPIELATTGADGTFRLSLPTNRASRVYATLVARSGDGRLGL